MLGIKKQIQKRERLAAPAASKAKFEPPDRGLNPGVAEIMVHL
jgi:hypothetical protein